MSLKFDSGRARSTATNISRQGESAQAALTKVENEIAGMREWWAGESLQAFDDQFQELKPSLNKMVDLVQKLSKQLNSIAEEKDRFENSMAQQIRK